MSNGSLKDIHKDIAVQREQQELAREAADAQIPSAQASKVIVVPMGVKAIPPPVPPKPKGLVARAKRKVQKSIAGFKQAKPSAPPKDQVMKPSVYSQLKKKLGGSAEKDEAQRFRKQMTDSMAAQRDTNFKMFQMLSKQIHKNGIEAQQEAMKTGEKIADVSHRIEDNEKKRKEAEKEMSKQINKGFESTQKGFNEVTQDLFAFKKAVAEAFTELCLQNKDMVKSLKDVQLELRNVHKRIQYVDGDGDWTGPGVFLNGKKYAKKLLFVKAPQIKDIEIEAKKQEVAVLTSSGDGQDEEGDASC